MYRSIETDTWSDPWFSELGAPAKLIFLYLVTNGHVDPSGCCEVTLRIMAFETGLEREQLTKIIPKLAPQIVWWPEHDIFWVRNFLRRQAANTNPANFRKSASRALVTRPGDVQAVVLEQYPELIMDEDASSDATKGKDASPMHADASPMHAETVSVSVSVSEQQQKQKKEKGLPTAAVAAHRAMFGALCDSFGKPTPGVEHDKYEAAAKQLVTAGADPSEIPHLCEAWGWINTVPPRVNSLVGSLTILRKTTQPTARSPNGKHPTPMRVDTAPLDSRWADVTFEAKRWQPGMDTPHFDEATDSAIASLGGWQQFVRDGGKREAFQRAYMGVSA